MRTLDDFLGELDNFDLAVILKDLSDAAIEISDSARVNVSLGGETGGKNIHGDEVKEFDQLANEIFKQYLGSNGAVKVLVSEEDDRPIITKWHKNKDQYTVFFDPLDGSSNIDSNIAIGSVFSVYRYESDKTPEENLLPDLRKQICAGYVMYSTATVLVLVYKDKVSEFMLNPESYEFIQVNENLKIPADGKKFYSINESNFWRWNSVAVRMFINRLKYAEGYSVRWVGTLVADFHRTLKQGGVFLYPGDSRNENGKLRLMYEVCPLSLIIEAAGGMAIHESGAPILDLKPRGIHQKVPFIFGGKKEVELYKKILKTIPKTG